ncbi:MAG: antitoxin of toxin-antitoxin stability system [Candidatus Cloacimonetes bacterium]|jgi:hypothetical protein|nr:antitoxin of toxin-antitoxin stability system [Candidatus Cloacimonadota bacterium]
MNTHVHTTYQFDELSDEAKEKSIESHYDWNVDGYEWHEWSFDDFKEVGKILGIEIKDIYFSGFSSQGDGACFEGNYSYEKQSLKNIKAYAPLDEDLHNIAKELQKIQRKNFYGLWANVKHSGHYYHEMSTNIQVGSDNESMGGANDEAHEGIQEILRSFMQWMYSRLEKEHDYLTSEEAIKESIIANEVEFNEDGSNHY